MSEWEPGFITHWSVWRGETYYSLLICFPLHSCLCSPHPALPTSLTKSKDLEEGVQTEGGGAGSQGGGHQCLEQWGTESTPQVPVLKADNDFSSALSQTTQDMQETVGRLPKRPRGLAPRCVSPLQ